MNVSQSASICALLSITLLGCGESAPDRPAQQEPAPPAGVQQPAAAEPQPARQGPALAAGESPNVAQAPAGRGDGTTVTNDLKSPLARALFDIAEQSESVDQQQRNVVEWTLRDNDAELSRSLGDNPRRKIMRANVRRGRPVIGRGRRLVPSPPPPGIGETPGVPR